MSSSLAQRVADEVRTCLDSRQDQSGRRVEVPCHPLATLQVALRAEPACSLLRDYNCKAFSGCLCRVPPLLCSMLACCHAPPPAQLPTG